jgi:phospholipase C
VSAQGRSSFLDLVQPRRGTRQLSRRAFLGGSAGVLAAGVIGGRASGVTTRDLPSAAPSSSVGLTATQQEALDVLGRSTLRLPNSLPNPSLLPGTDTLPGIDQIVVIMLENHSFDNVFGMLGRGDGWTLGADGLPTATNPYADGSIQRAFPMPTTCQLNSQPSQEWQTSNLAYDGGKMDGFVRSPIGPGSSLDVGGVAMGYYTSQHLPFTYSLGSIFPIADRWFCSVLGQTDPNRRYLIAATSSGMTDDISTSPSPGNLLQDALLAAPANGTIFDRLSAFGISWTDYTSSFPLGATPELYPQDDTVLTYANMKAVDDFFSDAANGQLPSFSLVEPDYDTQSQENPQNMAVGEAFLAQVIEALGSSPQWKSSLLVFTYDEHGGYYDHVPPPVALAPDAIVPVVQPGESTFDSFERYGFRVPGMIVSPYSKRNYVGHQVYDHTSVLALLERKWNLPAMTYRDANANDLTDMIDLDALGAFTPTFPELPTLAAPGDTPAALACSTTGPGTIPPPGTVSPAP